ncbi:MAG: ImmA/IrrE family metallo-endopeptidase [Alphaproteobacteria bacterium]|nr:ImmA/IrrE family metallo-endopeptidase [Alphaproteobacteria bacterium]
MNDIASALSTITSHQAAAPVKLSPIVEELGIKLYGVSNWPNGISGMLKKDASARSGFAIYVNTQHPHVRQRFTIAHELAHYILHRDQIGDGITDDALYRSGLSNWVEAAANKQAADILMPWHLINRAIDAGASTLPELAALFEVSVSAMAIRLGVPNES